MKSALITGAAGGVGQALCHKFHAAGYLVIALDEVAVSGFDSILLDLARFVDDPEYRHERLVALHAQLPSGALDVLVNNAATQIVAPLEVLLPQEICRTMNVNVMAPFFLIKELLEPLRKTSGCVVNIASIHACQTKPGFSAYATSKAALLGMTRALAVELGGSIRVNCISPAAINTPMLRAGFADNQDGYAKLESYHPVGRIGDPGEVAGMALFLASDAAKFINGADIPMDGGIAARLHDPS